MMIANAKKLTELNGINVECQPAGMTVIIADWIFEELNIDPILTYLREPIISPCDKEHFSSTLFSWMKYQMPLSNMCGTQTEINSTHIIFSNQVSGLSRINN
jgi:hypothetical protein